MRRLPRASTGRPCDLRRVARVVARRSAGLAPPFDDDEVAVVLFTSGTTSEPKSALLRHRHLMAYLSRLGRVRWRRARRSGARHGAAVSRGRNSEHVVEPVRRPTAGVPANVRPGVWLDDGSRRASHQRHGRADDARRESSTPSAARRPTFQRCESLSYGGAKVSERVLLDALAAVPRHRVRQRLRADRDGVDHRRARTRRSPRRSRLRRPGRSPSVVVGRPGAADGRDRDPRRRSISRCRPGEPA